MAPAFCARISGVFGIVISIAIVSFIFTIFFTVTGTLWANAKRSFENDSSKIGSSEHVSILMCDKLGDIFKDLLAPVSFDLFKFVIIFLALLVGLILKVDLFFGAF